MANIVITGASSGIGAALALRYTAPGNTLALMGRDESRLSAVTALCRKRGAVVFPGIVDVRDRSAMVDWLTAFDAHAPIDLVIANAGIMAGTPPGGAIEPPDDARAAIEINLLGTLNTVQPILPMMMKRGRGQIAIVSSVAAFGPVPDAPSYAASKAALLNYGLSLRALLASTGVRVSVICPGYVTTPMMRQETGPKPFEMAAERAADIIHRGLERNRGVISFPFLFSLMSRLTGLLPDRLRSRAARSLRFTVTATDTAQEGSGSKSSV